MKNVVNDVEITFTYKEAKERGIGTPATFNSALKKLHEVGFIDVNILGVYPLRPTTFYVDNRRWKKYGTSEFIRKQWEHWKK